jgi:hypothetical protein
MSEQIALMCAEALPWRCHRSLMNQVSAWRRSEKSTHKIIKDNKLKDIITKYPATRDVFIKHEMPKYAGRLPCEDKILASEYMSYRSCFHIALQVCN